MMKMPRVCAATGRYRQSRERSDYEENGDGGFTSDLSTSVFDFFVSFFASSFNFLAGFFGFFNPLPLLAIVSSPCGGRHIQCREFRAQVN